MKRKSPKELYIEQLESLIDRQRHKVYLMLLQKLAPKPGHILELACGYGRITIPLALNG